MAEVITIEDSPERNQATAGDSVGMQEKFKGTENSHPEKKPMETKRGADVAISPAVLAKVRMLERNSSNSEIGSFCALSASAQKLLPGKPVTLSMDEIKKLNVEKESSRDNTNFERDSGSQRRDGRDKKEPERKTDDKDWYSCELCGIQVNSFLTWETHIQGKKHQKKLAATISNMEKQTIEPKKMDEGSSLKTVMKLHTTPRIQSKLDAVYDPVIGLNYVREIWRIDPDTEAIYYCKICNSTCHVNSVIDHIVGYRHRLFYLKENVPKLYEKVKNLSVKKSELSKILENHARNLENLDGRGKMKVEQEVERTSPEPYRRNQFPQQDTMQQEKPYEQFTQHVRELSFESSPKLSAIDIKSVSLYASSLRLMMLKELVDDIDPKELRSNMDASRLQGVIDNFKKSLCEFYKRQSGNYDIAPSALYVNNTLNARNRPDFAGFGHSGESHNNLNDGTISYGSQSDGAGLGSRVEGLFNARAGQGLPQSKEISPWDASASAGGGMWNLSTSQPVQDPQNCSYRCTDSKIDKIWL